MGVFRNWLLLREHGHGVTGAFLNAGLEDKIGATPEQYLLNLSPEQQDDLVRRLGSELIFAYQDYQDESAEQQEILAHMTHLPIVQLGRVGDVVQFDGRYMSSDGDVLPDEAVEVRMPGFGLNVGGHVWQVAQAKTTPTGRPPSGPLQEFPIGQTPRVQADPKQIQQLQDKINRTQAEINTKGIPAGRKQALGRVLTTYQTELSKLTAGA